MRPALLRGLIVIVGLLLIATACETEIEGSDGTVTRLEATVQIRYSEAPDRSSSADLDDASVDQPLHVFLAYLGSDIEGVEWTLDGKSINEDSSPPFDLVGNRGSKALPFDPTKLVDGEHTVTAKVRLGNGATLEVDAAFTATTGITTVSVPPGQTDLLSADQRSLEGGTSGWRDQGNSVISSTADAAKTGRRALLATVSKDGMWTDDEGTSRVGTDAIAAGPRKSYTGQAFVRVGDAGSQARCEVRFYKGWSILETTPGAFADAPADRWTPVACTGTAPSETTHVGLRILVDDADWGEEFMVDDAHLWGEPSERALAQPSAEPAAPKPAPAPAPAPKPAPAPAPKPAPAPAPKPAPQAGQFPDASTTGPSGRLSPSGSINVTRDGTVIENLDVSGTITVNANNVTIRNTRVKATGHYGINVEGKGVLIEDVEIAGGSGCSHGLAPYGEWTARRIEVHGCVIGIGMKSNQTLEYSYCHDLRVYGSTHNDCIQTVGGSNSVIRGNNLNAPYHQTSAIIIQTEFGPARNWLIENNRLSGGGYSIYSQPKVNGTPTGLTIRNNVFVRGSQKYGTHYLEANNVSWSGNRFDDGSALSR
jgi:hypothetical protein